MRHDQKLYTNSRPIEKERQRERVEKNIGLNSSCLTAKPTEKEKGREKKNNQNIYTYSEATIMLLKCSSLEPGKGKGKLTRAAPGKFYMKMCTFLRYKLKFWWNSVVFFESNMSVIRKFLKTKEEPKKTRKKVHRRINYARYK